MKIDIEFKPAPPLPGLKQAKRCAVADIHYEKIYGKIDPSIKDGYLIYIKPVVLEKDDPPDVTEYKAANPAFPHESTADQWSESQTESYRMLGLGSIQAVFTHWGTNGFEGLRKDAENYLSWAAKAAARGQQ